MRLLYVHDRLGTFAGAEANAHGTASEFARRGHALGLLHGPGTGRDEAAWHATFPTRFPLPTTDTRTATTRALNTFQPEAVYVHKMSDLGVLESLVEHGTALVRMVHDHDIYCLRSYRYNYFSRRICSRPASLWCVFPCLACVVRNHGPGLPVRWASYRAKRREIALNRRFHRMVVVTPFMREELLRNGFDPSRIAIHPPVPKPTPPPPPPVSNTTPSPSGSSFSNRNLIVYAGQLVRGKGVDVLLHALARVQAPFECLILGEGNHRAACEALSRRLNLQGRVSFRGFLPRTELEAHYRECSLVVVPSVWPEPIATIGLEVMRHGLPVVAFDSGGIRDWLTDGHNGFLVPWMDRDAFARRVDQLLTDKDLARRMGANGKELASRRFDFDRYISDLEELLRTACLDPTS